MPLYTLKSSGDTRWLCWGLNYQHSPLGAFAAAQRQQGTWQGLAFFRVSTLVGQHCKGCQQIIIKTTKNEVRGHRQMALLAYLKWVCHHKTWKVQKTSKTDGQTKPFLTTQGDRAVGVGLALQLLSAAYSV